MREGGLFKRFHQKKDELFLELKKPGSPPQKGQSSPQISSSSPVLRP